MPDQTIPYGYCQCGCGRETSVVTKTSSVDGVRKGDRRRYLRGHVRHRRVAEPRYTIEDLGHESPCWVWQFARMKDSGYGIATAEQGTSRLAHRVFYERHRGPIPDGLVIDHLCGNKSCVNPDHLEAVTQGENVRRALGNTTKEKSC